MPIRTLKITDGPNFRGFALVNGILTETHWDQVFTMDQEIPEGITTIHKDKKKFQMPLKMFGAAPGDDHDLFVFISYMNLTFRPKEECKPSQWFYVGTYNVRTCQGVCEEFDAKEFFKSAAMRTLFPNLVP